MKREIEIFNNYYSNFDGNEPNIKRKYYHTFRVVSYANKLAESLNLTKEDIDLANICALFHDIGRFNQYKFFKTYDDSKSLDHGNEGEKVLKELNYNNEIVLKAVRNHNKYKIENDLSNREKLFCNITRDADKLDIMMTQGNSCRDSNYLINKNIFDYFKNNELLDDKYDDNSSTFVILRILAFIFDLNFKKSIEIILDKNLINEKLELINREETKDDILIIKKYLNDYIKNKFKINID